MEARVVDDLTARLARCTAADRRRLQRRAKRLKAPGRSAQDDLWRRFDEDLCRCEAIVETRAAVLPAVKIPEALLKLSPP